MQKTLYDNQIKTLFVLLFFIMPFYGTSINISALDINMTPEEKNDHILVNELQELGKKFRYTVDIYTNNNFIYFKNEQVLSGKWYLQDIFNFAYENPSNEFAQEITKSITENNNFCFPALMQLYEKRNSLKNSGANKNSLETILTVINEFKNIMTENYKIHLMPYPEDVALVLEDLFELFEALPELSSKIGSLKVLNQPHTCLAKNNPYKVPFIVIYVTGKENAQYALNKLVEYFTENTLEGMNTTPRHNQKVTDLIYYAQGDGNEKTMYRNCFVQKPPCPESAEYVYYTDKFCLPIRNHNLNIPEIYYQTDSEETEYESSKEDDDEEESRNYSELDEKIITK